MSTSSCIAVGLAVAAVMVAAAAADPGPLSRYGRHHRGHHRPSPPLPTPTPPPPSPPSPIPPCNCALCDYSHCCLLEPPNPPVRGSPAAPRPGGGGGGGGGGGNPPFYRGLPRPGGGGGGGGGGAECVTPLAALMTCGSFLTGSEVEAPTPQSECCSGLRLFLNTSSAARGGNDRILRCLCPVILGDVNKMLPKPMDPVRMMYLPIACGVVLPPQLFYICFTGQGQQTLPLVGRIPDVIWDNSSAASTAGAPQSPP